jgi:hypothetical protein
MSAVRVDPVVGELLSVQEVAQRYVAHAERRGRKKSTAGTLAPASGSTGCGASTPTT